MKKLAFIAAIAACMVTPSANAARFDVNTLESKELADHVYARGWLSAACEYYKLDWITEDQFASTVDGLKGEWDDIVDGHHDLTWTNLVPLIEQMYSDEPKCMPILQENS